MWRRLVHTLLTSPVLLYFKKEEAFYKVDTGEQLFGIAKCTRIHTRGHISNIGKYDWKCDCKYTRNGDHGKIPIGIELHERDGGTSEEDSEDEEEFTPPYITQGSN